MWLSFKAQFRVGLFLKACRLTAVTVSCLILYQLKDDLSTYSTAKAGIETLVTETKLGVVFSEHDSTLQHQIMKTSNKTFDLFPWVAFCDERNGGLPKAIVILVLTKQNVYPFISEITQLISCSPDHSRKHPDFSFSRVFQHEFLQMGGFFLICPFERSVECPERISLRVDGVKTTNSLVVERQYPRDSFYTKSRSTFTSCLPPATRKNSSVSARRVIETLEYLKLSGVDHVYVSVFEPDIYQQQINPDLDDVIKHYEQELYLTTYKLSMTRNEVTFRNYRDIQSFCNTYCVLKNALRYDYIIVHDWDEVMAFDFNKFRSLSEVILNDKQKYGSQYRTYFLKDTVLNHNCVETAPTLDYTGFIIAKAHYYFERSINCGKSIHDSTFCLVAFPHFCLYRRKEEAVALEGSKRKMLVHNETLETENWLRHEYRDISIRSFHYRVPYDHLGMPAKFAKNWTESCAVEIARKTNWLAPISASLSQNSKSVVNKLKLR